MNQNKLKICDYCLILKKSANMGETSMNEIRSIKQSILEIDIDWTLQYVSGRLTFWRLGISKYYQYSLFRNTFQCHSSRITDIISFWMDNRCEAWKIYIHSIRIILLLLRIVNEHESSSYLPSSALSPSVMDCNDGRSIQIISFQFIQYFQLLLTRILRMHDHLM